MATWSEFIAAAPDFAADVEKSFSVGKHKVMATLRKDGSPRVSGTELNFISGEAWLGSMPGAMKVHDLQRDPRMAIHSPTVDEAMSVGDAKITGRAVEVTDPEAIKAFAGDLTEATGMEPPQPFNAFKLDITEVVRTWVDGNDLVVESWHEGRGLSRIRRQ